MLRQVAIVDLRHVAQIDGRAIDNFDRQMIQIVNEMCVGVHCHRVFRRADFGGAAGQDKVLRVDGADDILRLDVFGLERGQAQIHRDDALLATVRKWNHRTGHVRQTDANLIGRRVCQFLLRHF